MSEKPPRLTISLPVCLGLLAVAVIELVIAWIMVATGAPDLAVVLVLLVAVVIGTGGLLGTALWLALRRR
ncbi:hypothetical protein [Nocardia sp. NPDC127526]|uniref:hypothetical protein n=1 Tax=Nocardia sp. NPDC127526 TaxID=3345393 RepID=UPI003629B731